MEEVIDLRELYMLLKRNLLLIISVTLIAMIIGAIVSFFLITPVFEASATMIVNKSENTGSRDVTYNDLLLTQKLVKTYSVIMESDMVLNRVIEALKLDIDTDQLRGMLNISGINDTEVIRIKVSSVDPQLAANIANEITRQAPEEIIRAVKAGSVEVIDPASVPTKPVKPRKAMNTAIAGLLGALVSIGAVFLKYYFDDTIKTEDDIREKLKLPVLGVLPLYRPENGEQGQKKRGKPGA